MIRGSRAVALFLAVAPLWLIATALHEGEPSVFSAYPVPPASKQLLFYVQRNKNANAIVYEAVMDASGTLDARDPVRVQWIRYTQGGKRDDLGVFEASIAYGVKHRGTTDNVAKMIFNASNKYPFRVIVRPDGQAEARMVISGKAARLHHVEVQADEKSWLPKVLWVDIIGNDLTSGERIIERFIP